MAWPVPLPAATGDEAADLAAFLAWGQVREQHFYPERCGSDGARLEVPREFTYYLGVPEPSWLGKDDRGPDGAFLCSGIPKFVSAARLDRYRSPRERWPVRMAGRGSTALPRYGIDSGAYIALTGNNKNVPWFAEDDVYGSMILRFIDNNGWYPDFVAPQDLPCEPPVLAVTGLTVRDHQDLTTASYLWLVREFPMVPWMPVLQGWEPGDHAVHARMYADAGVDLAACHRVGVGSICRLTELGGLVERIRHLEDLAASGLKLHGFGIKTSALPLIGHLLTSADSMAWSQHVRHNRIRLPGCTHAGDCRNCYTYAVQWREHVLATLPTTAPDRTTGRAGTTTAAGRSLTAPDPRRNRPVDTVPLAFVGICPACGARMEPCPAEGPGESWKAAEQWLFLAMQEHKAECRPAAQTDEHVFATLPTPPEKEAMPTTASTTEPVIGDDLFAGLAEFGDLINAQRTPAKKKPTRKRAQKVVQAPAPVPADKTAGEAEYQQRLQLLHPTVERKPLGLVEAQEVAEGVFAEVTGMLPDGRKASLVGWVIQALRVVKNYEGWTTEDCMAVTVAAQPTHLDGVAIAVPFDADITVLDADEPPPWRRPTVRELIAEAGLVLGPEDEQGDAALARMYLSESGGPVGNHRPLLKQTIVDEAIAGGVWPGPVEVGATPLRLVREGAHGALRGTVDGVDRTVVGEFMYYWIPSYGAVRSTTVNVQMRVTRGDGYQVVTVAVPATGEVFMLGADGTEQPDEDDAAVNAHLADLAADLDVPGPDPVVEQVELWEGLAEFGSLMAAAPVAIPEPPAAAAPGQPRTMPLADVQWGAFGQIDKGLFGPDGSKHKPIRGYVTSPPRIFTGGEGGANHPKFKGKPMLSLNMVMPRGDRGAGEYGFNIGLLAYPDAVFTVLDAPADRPLTEEMRLSGRMPVADLRSGDVFYIWNEPGLTWSGNVRTDVRRRYHVQDTPVLNGGTASLPVLVNGEGETVTQEWPAYLWADVEDPREQPWVDAADAPAGVPVGPTGAGLGRAGDGLDEVRAVLHEASLDGKQLRLPEGTLPKALWQAVHDVLKGMGAAGGSRRGMPYRFETDRSADLRAFVAGGPAPQPERTTKGWVPTPAALATHVVARFAELGRLRDKFRMLEPSAGCGALIDAVLKVIPNADVCAVESDPDRARALQQRGRFPVHQRTFEDYAAWYGGTLLRKYDLIIMNPPYAVTGNRTIWIDHVRLAWDLLAEGGRLVAILPGVDWSRGKPAALRGDLVGDVHIETLPARSFRESGTDFDTCVLAVTKAATGDATPRVHTHASSIYRPADGEGEMVDEVDVSAKAALASPVQRFRSFGGGDKTARYVGRCVVCAAPCWTDGDNSPLGVLGMNAVAPLRADEQGAEGPDVCLCWTCYDSKELRDRGEARARTLWTHPAESH
jgi:hypothetical protein